MIESIFGSSSKERVLVYLYAREQGYAREIARFFNVDLDPVQKQLERLETGGVIYSRRVGKTVLFAFNPRFPFLKELQALLEKVVGFYPEDMQEKLLMNRRRPRRRGKPL